MDEAETNHIAPNQPVRAPGPGTSGKLVLVGLGVGTILLGVGAALLPLTMPNSTGAIIGWLLLLAGTFEITAGVVRGFEEVRIGRIGAGGVTALAGLLFILNPLLELFPTLYLVIAWLLVRGVILLSVAFRSSRAVTMAVAISGLADMLLALVLIAGIPVAGFVVSVFGPTPELVAHFAWIFAASFVVTGLSLLLEPYFRGSDRQV
jgi:uncharacterized membrane protein HdeD (DUF308 family)